MNTEKSQVIVERVQGQAKQELIDVTCFVNCQLPFRYLGVPISSVRQ